MTQTEAIKIFNIVKNDDLTSFCMLEKKHKKLLEYSFGRFPILSVCYMYNSKKIIKKFEKELAVKSEFTEIYEPFALYRDFRLKSQKSLRLYATQIKYVMPIEMLAILGQDWKVKKSYETFVKSNETDSLLKKIYELKGQKISIKDKNLKISLKKMSKQHLKTFVLTQSIAFSGLIFVGLVLFVFGSIFGLGLKFNPRKVYSFEQLENLSNKKNMSVVLQNDITFTKKISWKEYKGTIFGNNKTITIEYDCKSCMFDKFLGTIKDLNIVFKNFDLEIDENLGLLANENFGQIENVNIECEANISFENEAYFCGFAVTNSGYIHNSNIKLVAEVESNTTSDAYASGIAGINNGVISSCNVLDNSSITANTVDIAGIAIKNMQNAEISNCSNNAVLTQETNLTTWSPNVAGIAIINYGEISNCKNNGNLKIENTSSSKTQNRLNYIGGIVAINFSTIYHSKNECEITVNTVDVETYAGGIAGYSLSNFKETEISECGAVGNFNITKDDNDTFVYCGGIAGFLSGDYVNMYTFLNATVSNCYSICTFSSEYSEETKNMSAMVVGATKGNPNFYITFENVHCLATANTDEKLAIIYVLYVYGYEYIFVQNQISESVQITVHASENAIKSSDVYWE